MNKITVIGNLFIIGGAVFMGVMESLGHHISEVNLWLWMGIVIISRLHIITRDIK